MELAEVRERIGLYDARSLYYPWQNPELDRLCVAIQQVIKTEEKRRTPRGRIFREICGLAGAAIPEDFRPDRATIPYLTEPWYC